MWKSKKLGRPKVLLSSIYCNQKEMRKDFDLFIPVMNIFWEINKEGLFLANMCIWCDLCKLILAILSLNVVAYFMLISFPIANYFRYWWNEWGEYLHAGCEFLVVGHVENQLYVNYFHWMSALYASRVRFVLKDELFMFDINFSLCLQLDHFWLEATTSRISLAYRLSMHVGI